MAFAVILISCFVLTSCGSDDNEPDEPGTNIPGTETYEDLIVGEWQSDYDDRYRIVFLANGTGYDKYRRIDDKWYIEEPLKWSVKGSKLLIKWEGGDNDSFSILNIDKTELVIRPLDDTEDDIRTYTRVK